MSLMSSLAAATTGLNAASTDLSVISDNIANANTVGFKAQRAVFDDALAQNVAGGNGQIGLGTQLGAVEKMMTQGALQSTGVATDLALQGDGFFMVSGTSADGRTGQFLTRAGQFTIDQSGFMVNQAGLRVQGYTADPNGNMLSAIGDLQVGNANSSPRTTGTVTVKGNLASDEPVLPASTSAANAAATAQFSTSVTIYNSLGKDMQAQIYFKHTNANGTWEYTAVVDGGLVGGAAGTPTTIASGTMAFDTTGKLTTVTPVATNFTPTGAAQQSISINFGDPTGVAGGTGLQGMTQFASTSATTFVGQDGYPPGQLTSVQIDKKGIVTGVFTNGQTRALAQIGVARCPAPQEMQRTGGGLYAATLDSGQPVLGAAGDGGRAFMTSGSVEQSNVDIAEQFVRMIAAQRSYEANSKTITTADQLLSELIAMKR
jgi:flagellar hook protein FlgE